MVTALEESHDLHLGWRTIGMKRRHGREKGKASQDTTRHDTARRMGAFFVFLLI
ncbi:hypothetical protein CERZMDRAFT_90449 [Cercospora zeae-maydis SCOH1-5]|uniref:Uncharacterized protein n=1 Tax=Cercospora zeae-maydis SCOH1-5 TaxID=717836 RepID=A0A6A6FJM5_9PEZI|nr:hypothetical protein CERZMDRAFT_90449 [Cercospora zeae-maydis SCOH1-5]